VEALNDKDFEDFPYAYAGGEPSDYYAIGGGEMGINELGSAGVEVGRSVAKLGRSRPGEEDEDVFGSGYSQPASLYSFYAHLREKQSEASAVDVLKEGSVVVDDRGSSVVGVGDGKVKKSSLILRPRLRQRGGGK